MLNFFRKRKKEPENFKDFLFQFKELKENFERILAELEALKKESKFNIQKIDLVRFNPFKEVRGNQSFSLIDTLQKLARAFDASVDNLLK